MDTRGIVLMRISTPNVYHQRIENTLKRSLSLKISISKSVLWALRAAFPIHWFPIYSDPLSVLKIWGSRGYPCSHDGTRTNGGYRIGLSTGEMKRAWPSFHNPSRVWSSRWQMVDIIDTMLTWNALSCLSPRIRVRPCVIIERSMRWNKLLACLRTLADFAKCVTKYKIWCVRSDMFWFKWNSSLKSVSPRPSPRFPQKQYPSLISATYREW